MDEPCPNNRKEKNEMADCMITKLLDEEIEKTLGEVSRVETGSDQAKAALIKLDKLHGQRVKELEAQLKEKQRIDTLLMKQDESKLREEELKLKVSQIADELELKRQELVEKEAELQEVKKARRWRTVLDFFGITAPLAVSGWWMYKGMKFESEGQIYSSRTAQWVGNLTRLFRKG
jgi:hypothetical protein